MAWTDHTWVTGETITANLLNGLRDDFRWLHDLGSTLASATTITPTTEFHKVSGTTTIDNIATPTAGNRLMLWFTGALTIRNNGGGTGNIRTSSGSDIAVVANEIRQFRSDGTTWQETGARPQLGMTALSDVSLAADAASVDIQNIAGGGHLQGVAYARTDKAGLLDDIGLRLNNDSAANYDKQQAKFTGTGPGISGGEVFGATILTMTNGAPGSTAPAGLYGTWEWQIPHYQSANQTVVDGIASTKWGISTGLVTISMQAGFYRLAGAITRLTYLVSGGGTVYKAGSRFSHYTF